MNLFQRIKERALGRGPAGYAPEWTRIESGPLEGREMMLDTAASASWRQMANGQFESFLHEKLKELRNWSGLCVWDVGAHFGYHTLCLAQLVGADGRVAAFEPNPALAERLNRNAARNPELTAAIEIEPVAVSDSNGRAEMVCTKKVDGNASWGHLAEVAPPMPVEQYADFEKSIVNVVSLDAWHSRTVGAPPALIKIDVEGAELNVLQGARDTIAAHRPQLAIEIHTLDLIPPFEQFCIQQNYVTELLESAEERRFYFASPTEPPA
jgi:FkbM family methyltransferase